MTGRRSLLALVVLCLLLSTILGTLVRPLPALAAAPQTPENQSPSDGATGVSLTPTLQASGFIDEDNDSHFASKWRIGGHEYESSSQLTSFQVPSDVLEYSMEYTWQVSYCDNTSAWSEPSPLWSFTTMAEPQEPPAVTTEAASSVGSISATLNGNLSSIGTASSVSVSFDWGETESYGHPTSAVTMTGEGQFSAAIDGLTPGTTYHFRAVAVGDETAYGADLTFTTDAAPTEAPVVTTVAASGIGTTTATLNGNLSDLGTAGTVNVKFEWGLTVTYDSATTAESRTAEGGFSASLSGLAPNTTYYFRAVADGDVIAYGERRSFVTDALPEAPSVSTEAATNEETTSATLNGNLADMGTADTVDVYFRWGLTNEYGSTTPVEKTSSKGNFSAGLTELTAGTTYHFRAVAVGDGSAYGNDLTFTTEALPDEPAEITTTAASAIGSSSATLGLNLSSLGSAASVEVYMEWGPTPAYGSTTARKTVSRTGASSFAVSGLTPATTYHFRAVAAGDGTAYGSDLTFTTVAADLVPPVVTTLDAASIGTNSATLNLGLTAAGSAAAVQVSFEWGPTADYGQTTEVVAMSGPGSFSQPISGLAAATTYHFRAVAIGDGTAYGGDLTFTSGSPPPVPPTVKTGDADAVTGASSRLNGELSSLGTAASVTVSFAWGTAPGGPYLNQTQGMARTDSGAFYFDLDGLAPRTVYYFRAMAVGDGNAMGVEESFVTVGQAPRIDSLTAHSSQEGDPVTVNITGANLSSAMRVDLGQGIRVVEFTVVSDGEIRARVEVESGAESVVREVTVTTPTGVATHTVPAGFLAGFSGESAKEDGAGVRLWVYTAVMGVATVVGLLLYRASRRGLT